MLCYCKLSCKQQLLAVQGCLQPAGLSDVRGIRRQTNSGLACWPGFEEAEVSSALISRLRDYFSEPFSSRVISEMGWRVCCHQEQHTHTHTPLAVLSPGLPWAQALSSLSPLIASFLPIFRLKPPTRLAFTFRLEDPHSGVWGLAFRAAIEESDHPTQMHGESRWGEP